MKAKDTVMDEDAIWDVIKEYSPFGMEQRIAVAEAQAEISFRAGIKEVVELDKAITQHILQDANGNWSVESWRLQAWFRDRQAKLKEWGIK